MPDEVDKIVEWCIEKEEKDDNARLTIDEAQKKMQKSIDVLSEQLHGVGTIGASSSLVESVKVPYYGQKIILSHISAISTKGRQVSIKAFDSTLLPVIAKTCQEAGFNAHVFSKELVVVNLPDHSGDTRNEIIARIRKLAEEARISVRNVRKQFKQSLPKDWSKDELRREENRIQDVTDKAIQIIDDIVERKTSYVNK